MKYKKLGLILIFLFHIKAYSAHYLIEHDGNKIHVTANFNSHELKDINGIIKLYIPQTTWGTNFSQKISNINTNGVYDKEKATVILNKDEHLYIKYEIISLSKKKLIEKFTNNYENFIDDTKFYLFGFGLFIVPSNFKGEVIIKVKSKVKKVAYNLYPYFYQSNIIKTIFPQLNSLVILGSNNLAISNKNNVDLIIWSEGQHLRKVFEELALPAFAQQAEFWQHKNQKRKSAIIISLPAKDQEAKLGGNVLNESTVLFFVMLKESKIFNNIDELNYLFKHENLHFLFGKLLDGPIWFREGFTDYYVDKITTHYNKKYDYFIDRYNAKLKSYLTSPAYQCNDKDIDKYFFEIPYVQRLPYNKGYLIAGQIDSIINLDKALKKMISLCEKQQKYCKFTADNLIKSAGKLSSKQKKQLVNLVSKFSVINLNQQLLQNTSLAYKEQEVYGFLVDILNFWKKHYITGRELRSITGKPYSQSKYKILCISTDFATGQGYLKIQNDHIQEKISLPFTVSKKHIPYYKLSTY